MKRKFGRITVLLSVLVLLFALTSATYAVGGDNTSHATDLKEMGLFSGTDKGFELEKVPSRVQSAAMLVKLLGGEAEETSMKYAHPFKDVPSWATNYVGYMYKKGLTKGISATMFGSANNTSAKDFSTFMLKALGYKDGDFVYNDVLNFAQSKGLYTANEMAALIASAFTRNEMVLLAHNALDVSLKGSEDRLIDRLVDAKAVSVNVANELEYYDYPTVPMVITVDANGRLTLEYLYDKIKPEIYNEIATDYYNASGDLDLSSLEKLASVMFMTESMKISNYEYAMEKNMTNWKIQYKNNEHWLVSFMGLDKEVAYYFEQPRNLSPGTYDIALIKPSPVLAKRLEELTVEHAAFYKEKMQTLVTLTPEMFDVVKKEDGNNYISFNKDKMPAELAKFTSVRMGTIGPSSIDYELLLSSEFRALGKTTRNGLQPYNGDPLPLSYQGNIMMSFYDAQMNLVGVGFYVQQ